MSSIRNNLQRNFHPPHCDSTHTHTHTQTQIPWEMMMMMMIIAAHVYVHETEPLGANWEFLRFFSKSFRSVSLHRLPSFFRLKFQPIVLHRNAYVIARYDVYVCAPTMILFVAVFKIDQYSNITLLFVRAATLYERICAICIDSHLPMLCTHTHTRSNSMNCANTETKKSYKLIYFPSIDKLDDFIELCKWRLRQRCDK